MILSGNLSWRFSSRLLFELEPTGRAANRKRYTVPEKTANTNKRRSAFGLGLLYLSSLALSTSLQLANASSALAASSKKSSSTMLLPLTPRIDDAELPLEETQEKSQTQGKSQPQEKIQPTKSQPAAKPSTSQPPESSKPETSTGAYKTLERLDDAGEIGELKQEEPKLDTLETTELKDQPNRVSAEGSIPSDSSSRLELEVSEDDLRMAEMDGGVTEDTTLKGTIQIVADDTEYDQDKNTFLGTGNAVAIIGGQNSKLEADLILYDQNTQMIDARGNVKILRDGQLTTGSAFKFNVNSDEYLITNPDTELNGTQVIARSGYGDKQNLSFKKGNLTLPKPIHMGRNAMWGTLSTGQEIAEKVAHPDIVGKPSYTFKARKMVYERYKDVGNLTVFGGRVCFGKFNVPIPKFVTTVGNESKIRMPVSPMLTNNLMSGGINIGPSFNTAVGKTGVLSWAPMVQLGGNSVSGDTSGGGIGLSGRVGFSNSRITSNLAYGSVSNLLVADFRGKINKDTVFQAGINRFMNDGMFGFTRPRLLAEVVHNKSLSVKIPGIAGVNFRSSGGWAQDNPQLINLNSDYAALFGGPTTVKTQPSAFRIQEQISVSTQPIFAVGNDKYGAKAFLFGGLGVGAYSTGEARSLLQGGPTLDTRLNRLHFQVGYTQSAVRGSSPFYFDRFIQGTRSTYISGDVKVNKWLTLGGTYGYNLNLNLPYQKSLSAVIGQDDLKLMVTRNFITGMNRVGFDIFYGQPVGFNKLVIKGNPDHGNLSGL